MTAGTCGPHSTWSSPLAAALQRFLEGKRAAGYRYRAEAQALGALDRLLSETLSPTDPVIISAIVRTFVARRGTESETTRAHRLTLIREVCRFLALDDPRTSIWRRRCSAFATPSSASRGSCPWPPMSRLDLHAAGTRSRKSSASGHRASRSSPPRPASRTRSPPCVTPSTRSWPSRGFPAGHLPRARGHRQHAALPPADRRRRRRPHPQHRCRPLGCPHAVEHA